MPVSVTTEPEIDTLGLKTTVGGATSGNSATLLVADALDATPSVTLQLIVRPGSVEEADPAEWREQIDINLLAPMYLSKAVIPDMRRRGDGHILNVSSTAGRTAGARHSGYSASKWGVTAFSESMRQELAPFGIRVTVVEPGATTTEVGDSIRNPGDRAAIQAHVSRGAIMHADDVAGAIVFALKQPPNVNVREIWIAPTSALR